MRIEEEIQKIAFESESIRCGLNIMVTSSWLNQKITSYLKNYNLTSQQFNVLRILKWRHPLPATINLITERMIDRTSNASRLVEKLRIKGLAERKQCVSNRRAVDIVITQKGLDLLDEINIKNFFDEIFNPLNISGTLQLNDLLNKLRV
jgi:DNA-binding MarR family transcriptional regulator